MPHTAVASPGLPPLKLLICATLALALAACGGGGGDPGAVSGGGTSNPGTGGGSTTPAAPTLAVSFVDASGVATNSLTAGTPLIAKATLRDSAGRVIPEALVTFSTDNNLALFSPSAGTALTDANGVATVTMRPASLGAGGAAKVSVTSTIAGATVTGERNFSVGATALTLSPITLTPASIPAYGSTTLSVDVLANGARYTAQQLTVNFSSACVNAGKATLALTATTNNGTAQAVYRDLGCGTTDAISISADGADRPVTATLPIAVPAAASVQFASAFPVEQSIVIAGQGGNMRTETATLKFKVFDIFNRPLQGQMVNFSVSTSDVKLNKASDTTDQNGEVITTVNSGSIATTFRVTASLGNGISTMSDSIVVTTGLPVQRAFSLSVGSPNIEGWNVDNIKTNVNVLLADQFGNPVADGTPVAFQTNIGAVGSSDKGACNLVNGGCSVDFRSQNPRVATPGSPATPCNRVTLDSTRPGLASVCASTTDGTNTVFARAGIFLSGSAASNVFLSGSTVPLTGTTDLGSSRSGDGKVFNLLISDINSNPMPAGTTVAVTSLTNASVVDVIPATVQNVFPHNPLGDDITGSTVSGNQGSYHRVTVIGNAPSPCVAGTVATFSVSITSPVAKLITSYPFRMTLTCP